MYNKKGDKKQVIRKEASSPWPGWTAEKTF